MRARAPIRGLGSKGIGMNTKDYIVAHHSLYTGEISMHRVNAVDGLEAMRKVARDAGWEVRDNEDPNDVCPDDTFAYIGV